MSLPGPYMYKRIDPKDRFLIFAEQENFLVLFSSKNALETDHFRVMNILGAP